MFASNYENKCNVKVLGSFTGMNYFVVCDASRALQGKLKNLISLRPLNCTEYKFPEKLILQNILLS